MMLLIGLDQLSKVAASFWLSEWTSNAELHNLTALPADSEERYQNNIYYLGIYGSLGLVQGNWKYEIHFGFAQILRIYPKVFCMDIDIKPLFYIRFALQLGSLCWILPSLKPQLTCSCIEAHIEMESCTI